MTAEIAVMNKSAIALAADSAVTIQTEGKQKIYNSVNKLFALSTVRPVGIMVFGLDHLMGIPWESVIKEYREQLGDKSFPALTDYTNHFFRYLGRRDPLFPKEVQDKYYEDSLRGYFTLIRADIEKKAKRILQKKGKITDSEVRQVVGSVVAQHHNQWDGYDDLPNLPKSFSQTISRKQVAMFRKTRDLVFQKLPIVPSVWRRLRQIAVMMATKQRFPSHISGVVIAGFGESEVFPSCQAYTVEAVMNGRMKMKKDSEVRIDRVTTAAIQPFAQSEMVYTFVEGIDPKYEQSLEGYLTELFTEYPEHIVQMLAGINDRQKKTLIRTLKQLGQRLLRDFTGKMKHHRQTTQVGPIMNSVAALPKDELAAMAESLVSLTSFKRRVSLDAETVGGPIDVAVISKGDGLIWIKRKHYFAPELNPDFFTRRRSMTLAGAI